MKCPLGILMSTILLLSAEKASAWDNTVTHKLITQFLVDSVNKDPRLLGPTNTGFFRTDPQFHLGFASTDPVLGNLGAIFVEANVEEDSPAIFSANHFYDPVTNSGLDDIIEPWPLLYHRVSGENSLSWAYSSSYLHSTTWENARAWQRQMLTARTPAARFEGAKEMLTCLGAVAHLIQDLSQPQHVRNDAHEDEVGTIGIETYAATNYDTIEKIKELYGSDWAPQLHWWLAPPANISRIFPDIPIEIQSLWDTQQFSGNHKSGPWGLPVAFGLGISEYVCRYFVSRDTMFSAEPPRQTILGATILMRQNRDFFHDFSFPKASDIDFTDKLFAGKTYEAERGGYEPTGTGTILWVYRPDPDDQTRGSTITAMPVQGRPWSFRLALTDADLDRAIRHLLPVAIDYTGLMLERFFHASPGVDAVSDTGERCLKLQIENRAPHFINTEGFFTDRLGTGNFYLYRDSLSGTRTSAYIEHTQAGPLFSGDKQECVWYPKPWYGKHHTLVYIGQVGTEPNGVAATSIDIEQKGMLAKWDSNYVNAGRDGSYIEMKTEDMECIHSGPSAILQSNRATLIDSNTTIGLLRNGVWESCRGSITVHLSDAVDSPPNRTDMGADKVDFSFTGVDSTGRSVSYNHHWSGSTTGFVRPTIDQVN